MRLAIPTTIMALVLSGAAAQAQEAAPPAPEAGDAGMDAGPGPRPEAGQAPPEQMQAADTQGETQVATQPGAFGREQGDRFASELMGTPVFAQPAGGAAEIGAGAEDGAIDAAELADFVPVGWVSDLLLGQDIAPRAVVVSLGDPAGAGAGTGTGAGAGFQGQEVAVEADRVRFLSDATVETIGFAVLDMDVAELENAPRLDRMAGLPAGTMDPAATGAGGWMMGRQPMGAPGVTMEGYTPVPVSELSVDNLLGAAVFGADGQSIGSVNDVVLDPQGGGVEYVVVDVGGFLGLGSRSVALGLEEMTILRDAGWNDLQVHVGADQAALEAMPEYEGAEGGPLQQ